MSDVYRYPKYYEIAFSFRDIRAEVDVFEECFRRFSGIPVKSVLELGCGNCRHMEELIQRGYSYTGLDLSESMLEYSRQKAARIGARVNLVHADMIDFALEAPVDFVYVMLGSLYAKSTCDLTRHFDSVARVLSKGGLYFLDWCIQFDPSLSGRSDSWQTEQDGIRVKTTVSASVVDPVKQVFAETITLDVEDKAESYRITGTDVRRAIYPQEFLLLVDEHEHLEFVGWWNNWDLSQPMEQATKISRPIALLRRI